MSFKALCGTGASRPRVRARSMASRRRWTPSLSYRCSDGTAAGAAGVLPPSTPMIFRISAACAVRCRAWRSSHSRWFPGAELSTTDASAVVAARGLPWVSRNAASAVRIPGLLRSCSAVSVKVTSACAVSPSRTRACRRNARSSVVSGCAVMSSRLSARRWGTSPIFDSAGYRSGHRAGGGWIVRYPDGGGLTAEISGSRRRRLLPPLSAGCRSGWQGQP
jgi:hypothetical protein